MSPSRCICILFSAIIRQTLCNGRNQRDSQYLSVNFIQISIDGENLGKNNIKIISLDQVFFTMALKTVTS